jgi:hypothetical protein
MEEDPNVKTDDSKKGDGNKDAHDSTQAKGTHTLTRIAVISLADFCCVIRSC